MKLVFSEARPDYAHYLFPYAVWAFREPNETPAQMFAAGFLPSGPQLERFYLCRHVRVALARFEASSENRRILRKGSLLRCELVPLSTFTLTPRRREFCLHYAETRLGAGIISGERIDRIFSGTMANHMMVFTEEATGREVGLVALYIEEPALAFYSFAFYDVAGLSKNLGMFLMTHAVDHFASCGVRHLYLGTCYSESALYKTQFAGTEFFNGVRWSPDLDELKHLIRTQPAVADRHLLECEDYVDAFWPGGQKAIAQASAFRLTAPPQP